MVTSDSRHRFTELAQLVAASDLVVSGRVLAVEPGRTFGAVDAHGDAAPNAIRSRVVTLEVRDVIAAKAAVPAPAPGTVVLVEEEATLLDRHPDRGRRRARDEGGRRGDLVPDRVAGP